MRANYNRQTRRATRCIKACSPRGYEHAVSPRWAPLTPNGDHLSQVAARIAEELELSPDAIDELLWGDSPKLEYGVQTQAGAVREN